MRTDPDQYLDLGGPAVVGMPAADFTPAPDGARCYNHFTTER
ncbi:hypothetical protein [Yinghuangia sp. YIM S10712]